MAGLTPIKEIKNLLEFYPQYESDVLEFIYCGEETPQDVLAWLKNQVATQLSREFLDANL
jgi:hypothetical protein